MRLCLNMLIFTHNLGNWLIVRIESTRLSGALGNRIFMIVSWITRVDDTRGGNWGCHPSIFSWKTWRPLLVACSAVSPLFIFFSKTDDLYLLIPVTITLLLLSLGCHPLEGVTAILFYLSDLVSLLFFVNLPANFFPSGVTHLEGVARGVPLPPLTDATDDISPFLSQ